MSIIAILRSIGMLQQMNIGKYSQKRHLCPNLVNETSATNSTNSPTGVVDEDEDVIGKNRIVYFFYYYY